MSKRKTKNKRSNAVGEISSRDHASSGGGSEKDMGEMGE